ncbi:putative hydrolase [Bacillus sp. TS-2]|nr:putative hydrolase [Bacillus sp. TS-2]
MIKAIFFDLDDTLLWDKKSVATALYNTCLLAAEKYDLDVNLFEQEVRKNAQAIYGEYDTFPFTQMIGINPFEGLWGKFEDKGIDFNKMKEIAPEYQKRVWRAALNAFHIEDADFAETLAETFPEERKKNPFVYEESYSVLEKLQGKYRLLLLTNGSPQLQNIKLTITPEIAPFFEKIIISGQFGKGKPDPSIFEHALEEMGLAASEVLMVGDNLNTDILGANRTGIQSVWINREEMKAKDVNPTFEIHSLHDLFSILSEC